MRHRFSVLLSCLVLLAVPTLAQVSDISPDRLVDIGGRKMHVHCSGSGSPTIILESSWGQFALDWWFVQPEVATFARVCSYDRAGLGWSDPGPFREHPEQIVADLHALLGAAGERPPYVFASMAVGAFYARAYQLRFPSEVVGFVFIEPSHEDTFIIPLAGKPTPLWAVSQQQASEFQRSLAGGPRPSPPPLLSDGPSFSRLPPNVLKARRVFEERSRETSTADDEVVEFESRRATAMRLHTEGRALGDRAVVVLTAERGPTGLARDVQAKVTALSQNSVQRVTPTGHFIHLEAPQLVVQAIADVVSAVKNHTRVAR